MVRNYAEVMQLMTAQGSPGGDGAPASRLRCVSSPSAGAVVRTEELERSHSSIALIRLLAVECGQRLRAGSKGAREVSPRGVPNRVWVPRDSVRTCN